jgi:hypothetical protein
LSKNAEILQKYLPQGSFSLVQPLLNNYPLQLRISRPRKTKFGDYRLPLKSEPHRISVNGNLNPYAFLITLLHEYAHLVAYAEYGRKIKPHGLEWQTTFSKICDPFMSAGIFPENIAQALKQSLVKGHASSATSTALLKALKAFDAPNPKLTILEDLPAGSHFLISNKTMVKGAKSRKRYRCKSISNQREYMVHPLAEVKPLENTL